MGHLKKSDVSRKAELVYNVFCVAGFVATALWCILTFSENHDICLVDLKEYNEDPNNVYPSISIVIINPFIDEKLRGYGEGINSTYYSKFLGGEYWDERMLEIDYDNVTIDLNTYFLGYDILGDNFSVISINNDSFTDDLSTSFGWRKPYKNFRSAGWQSYTVDPPYDTYGAVTRFLTQISIKIQTDIFKNSTRQNFYDYDQDSPTWGGFEIWFHYPNQLMEAWHLGMGKWLWPKQDANSSRNYAMIFERSKMDVLERRNKKDNPCIEDWKNHDQYVVDHIVSSVGCRPPHWKSQHKVPLCRSQKEMKSVLPPLEKHQFLNFVPPCRSITNFPFSYSEMDEMVLRFPEYFQITMTCADPTFKNIAQVKEYSTQTLIGNTGGYLGLILGCSVIQLPVFIFKICKRLKSLKLKRTSLLPSCIVIDPKPIKYRVTE